MKRTVVVISFVAAFCLVAVGFIILYSPSPDVDLNDIVIEDEPVALGPESADADIVLLSDGQGSIEVSPYRQAYMKGEKVKFTARPAQGWIFVRWEGDVDDYYSNDIEFQININSGTFTAKAVFEQE